MRTIGSGRPRRTSSGNAAALRLAAALAGCVGAGASTAAAEVVVPYAVEGDAIPASLTGRTGDAVRGRAIVVDRQRGLCLLCHAGPFPEERFQGTLAPNLAGAGARWSQGQLRLRLVDGRRINPQTIMPSYHRVEGLDRVGWAWQGKPVLAAHEIEDVVTFLSTLREP